jgi:hypothetical protein
MHSASQRCALGFRGETGFALECRDIDGIVELRIGSG